MNGPDRRQRMVTRRGFCARATGAASGVAASLLLPTAKGAGVATLPTVRAPVSEGVIRFAVDDTPLARVDGRVRVVTNAGSVLVARTSADSFVSVSAACSHEACWITGMDGADYVCPCHGSRFGVDGEVLTGPAEFDLIGHEVIVVDGEIEIRM